jgi:hypothetical protein
MESAKEALEEETRRWAFLCPVEPVAAPAAGLGEDGDIDPRRIPHRLDQELRSLTAMRDGWDELEPPADTQGVRRDPADRDSELGAPVATRVARATKRASVSV